MIRLCRPGPHGEPNPETVEGVAVGAAVMGKKLTSWLQTCDGPLGLSRNWADTAQDFRVQMQNMETLEKRKERIDREWSEAQAELMRRWNERWEPAVSRLPRHLRRAPYFWLALKANLTAEQVVGLLTEFLTSVLKTHPVLLRAAREAHLHASLDPTVRGDRLREFLLGTLTREAGLGPPGAVSSFVGTVSRRGPPSTYAALACCAINQLRKHEMESVLT